MTKYKKPVFKLKNTFSGKYITANKTGETLKHLNRSGEIDQQWKWNHGLESVAYPSFNIKFTDSGFVVLTSSDSTDKNQIITMRNGRISNKVTNSTLGVNENQVQSFQYQPENSWVAEYIGNDAAEIPFERLTPDKKPEHGSWPFDCEQILQCNAAPHQSCGCREDSQSRGIVYFMGPGSKLPSNLDFQSCEELKMHGVDISGHFMIKGIKTYCHSWSMKVINNYSCLLMQSYFQMQTVAKDFIESKISVSTFHFLK